MGFDSRRWRFKVLAATSLIACGCAMSAREPASRPPVYSLRILEVAASAFVAQGGELERFEIRVSRELWDGDRVLLSSRGIRIDDDLWKVYFGPTDSPGPESTEGGDFTFYFRRPATDVLTVWAGE